MKKLIITLGVIIGLLVAVAVIVPSFLDWKAYEQQARKMLVEKTGYDVQIAGDMGLSILPTPRLTVEKVKLYTPNFENKPLLSLDELKVLVNPFSLLTGKVQISSIVLANGEVLLHKDANDNNNWTAAVKDKSPNGSAETEANEAAQSDGRSTDVSIDKLYIENLRVRYEDLGTDTVQAADIETASLRMQSLTGPYDADIRLSHQNQKWTVGLKSEGYKKDAGIPLELSINDRAENMLFTYSGVADIADGMNVQGETALDIKDFAKFQSVLTGARAVSANEGLVKTIQMKGFVTASDKRVKIDNGAFSLNGSNADMAFELSGLGSDLMTVSSTISFKDVINLDAYKTAFLSASKSADTPQKKTTGKPGNIAGAAPQASVLPQSIALPKNLKGNLNISVPGLVYNGKKTGQVVMAATYENGALNGQLNAFSLPEKTSFNADASLSFKTKEVIADDTALVLYKTPQVTAKIKAETQNLRGVVVDWIGAVEERQIPAEMPSYIGADMTVTVNNDLLRLDLSDVDVGQTEVKGYISYKAGAVPLIEADINSGNLILPDLLNLKSRSGSDVDASVSKNAAPKSTEEMKKSVRDVAQKFPYDLDVKLSMQRLALGENVFSDLTADFKKKGKTLTLNQVQIGNHIGTQFDFAGGIADIYELTGLDLLLKVSSANIDPMLAAYGITLPEALPQPMGRVNGSLRLQGTLDKASFNINGAAYGFDMSASGTKNKLLQPAMPQTMKLALTHSSSEEAIRFLRPEYRAKSSLMDKPFKLAATLNNREKQTEIQGMVLNIGPSGITGDSVISFGDVPYVKASLAADTLPVSVLAGNNEARTNAGSTSSSGELKRSAGETPWSRDAINTAALRAVNADIVVTAQKFSYGHTVINNALVNATLNGGVLNISKITGKLDQGQIDGNIKVSATSAKKPIDIVGGFKVSDATVASVTKAILGRAAKKIGGNMAMNTEFTASGVSSSALINALNGQGRMQLIDPVLNGVDVEAMYKTFSSIDSFEGAILGFLSSATSSGQTKFNSVDKQFKIVNGVIPVDNWDVKADKAIMISNGKIDFPNWKIDLMNTIQIQGIDKLPSFGMRIYGPLDAPETHVTRESLESYMQSRVGERVKNVITDKLISEDVQKRFKDKTGIGIGDLLPLGQRQQPQDSGDAANDNTPQQQQPQQEQREDPAQQIFRGILNELSK